MAYKKCDRNQMKLVDWSNRDSAACSEDGLEKTTQLSNRQPRESLRFLTYI